MERLKELIAQREKLEDTVAQFERLTVSQLVQRTQLEVVDSDDSDDDTDDDKMNTRSDTGHPAISAEHKEMTSSKHRKTKDTNKSRNKPLSSKSSGGTWDYESSATPPTYKLEVINLLLFVSIHVHLRYSIADVLSCPGTSYLKYRIY